MTQTHGKSRGRVELRQVTEADVLVFFEQQRDPEAHHMVAFGAENPNDREAFVAKWAKILVNPTIMSRTVLHGGLNAGHVVCFERVIGRREVGYLLGREHWGRGVASEAMRLFLPTLPMRPLYAATATDNVGSLRVLEKCGFEILETIRAFATSRGEEIDEHVLILRV